MRKINVIVFNNMNNKHRMSPPIFVVLMLSIAFAFSAAVDAKNLSRMYGEGAPFRAEDLPPKSHLRLDLERLSPERRDHAMRRLHEISFPREDVNTLRVNQEGDLYYEDSMHTPVHPQQGDLVPTATAAAVSISPSQIFSLHSKPGSSRQVYINVRGFTLSGTAWNLYNSADPLYALPFSLDSDYYNFTQTEYDAIAEIWKSISEDFAPFKIDVTTEEPQTFGPHVGHILITNSYDRNGKLIACSYCSGVAYLNTWGLSEFYQPALVFQDMLSRRPKSIAEVSSHEFGHNLGLGHDGQAGGVEYYSGHGFNRFSWAPIMGSSTSANVTQWSKGAYSGANNTQDDIAIIASKLAVRVDAHGNSTSSAERLRVTNGTKIVSTSPVTDPNNTKPYNKGVISTRADVDYFSLDVDRGTISLTITPAWREVFYPDFLHSENLDVKASLLDQNGNVIYTSTQNSKDGLDTDAHLIASVMKSGRYYLTIDGRGEGNAFTGFTDYASIGRYFINGTVPVQPVVRFTSATYSVSETTTSLLLTVERTGSATGAATVAYATQDVTAIAGLDYTAQSGTLSFAVGMTSATISIPITNDATYEGDENFVVTLSNAVGAVRRSPSSTQVTIVDDDAI